MNLVQITRGTGDKQPCPAPTLIRAWVEGRLSPVEASALEDHVQLCTTCSIRAETDRSRLHDETPPVQVAVSVPQDSDVALAEYKRLFSPPRQPGELGSLGDYRIVRLLGAGGMGLVVCGLDPQLNREVAIKVIKPQHISSTARDRFLREAKAMAAIEHDHLIPIYHVGKQDDVPFLVMPLLKGESLADRLTRRKRLCADEVIRISRQIARGLAAAHQHGLVHRDVKPSNIWLEANDRVKLLDFGLVRAPDSDQLTRPGVVMGTPGYMAPEQASGGSCDHRSDLFSLGCVMYRMVSGEMPASAGGDAAQLKTLTLNDIPPALGRLIMQLLQPDPLDRPGSAAEVVAALERQSDIPEGAGSPARRWWLPVLGSAMLLAALLILPRLRGPHGTPGALPVSEPESVEAGLPGSQLTGLWARVQLSNDSDPEPEITLTESGRARLERPLPVLGRSGAVRLDGVFAKPVHWYVVWIDPAGLVWLAAQSSEATVDLEYPTGNQIMGVNPDDPAGTHLLLVITAPAGRGEQMLELLEGVGVPPEGTPRQWSHARLRGPGGPRDMDGGLPAIYLREIRNRLDPAFTMHDRFVFRTGQSGSPDKMKAAQ